MSITIEFVVGTHNNSLSLTSFFIFPIFSASIIKLCDFVECEFFLYDYIGGHKNINITFFFCNSCLF